MRDIDCSERGTSLRFSSFQKVYSYSKLCIIEHLDQLFRRIEDGYACKERGTRRLIIFKIRMYYKRIRFTSTPDCQEIFDNLYFFLSAYGIENFIQCTHEVSYNMSRGKKTCHIQFVIQISRYMIVIP